MLRPVIAACAAGFVLAAGIANAEPVLDQSLESIATGCSTLGTSQYRAQTFTVGITGTLTRFELLARDTGGGLFEIWNTTSGAPVAITIPSTPLASASLSFSNVGFQWVGADLSTGVPVTAGDVLALVMVGNSSSGGCWQSAGFNGYLNGSQYQTLTSTPTTWENEANNDHSFRTYVDPINEVSISPNTDPGGLKVGDSLTFTVSVDSVTPPADTIWEDLRLALFRAFITPVFPPSVDCADLSGLSPIEDCFDGQPRWMWDPSSLDASTITVTGDLASFTVLFDQPGTYNVYLEGGVASFLNPDNSLSIRELFVAHHDQATAILITVSENAEGLLQQLLEDVTDQVPGKALKNKVTLAMTYYASDDIPATCAVLADFKKQVKAQIGKKKISAVVGDKLMTDATAIMTEIGCFD